MGRQWVYLPGVGYCSRARCRFVAAGMSMHRELDERSRDVTEAVAIGVARARAIHKALGLPIVIWRDGRPVWVDAETLQPVPPPAGVDVPR